MSMSETPRMDIIGAIFAGPKIATSKIDWRDAACGAFSEERHTVECLRSLKRARDAATSNELGK
jgi:hypothetical protein